MFGGAADYGLVFLELFNVAVFEVDEFLLAALRELDNGVSFVTGDNVVQGRHFLVDYVFACGHSDCCLLQLPELLLNFLK
jgi:hypothetical protein